MDKCLECGYPTAECRCRAFHRFERLGERLAAMTVNPVEPPYVTKTVLAVGIIRRRKHPVTA